MFSFISYNIDNLVSFYRLFPIPRILWRPSISFSRCTTLVLIWTASMFPWLKWITWVLGWSFAVLSFRCPWSPRIILILIFLLLSSLCFLNGIARNGRCRWSTVWMAFCYRRLVMKILSLNYYFQWIGLCSWVVRRSRIFRITVLGWISSLPLWWSWWWISWMFIVRYGLQCGLGFSLNF